MAHFYRDEIISNLEINESILTQIKSVYASRTIEINKDITDDNDQNLVFLTYVIRFDNKGYRLFDFKELLNYFHQAKTVQRIVFTIESSQSLRTSRQAGTLMELRLDVDDPNNCSLVVTSDDRNWVDASFSAIKEILDKCKSKNGWARSPWAMLTVQISGVIAGFTVSLWAAAIISPKLTIEHSFILAFIFSLLIFSNLWAFLNQKILAQINSLFPNLKLYRPDKDKYQWLQQGFVVGISVAITLYLLSYVFSYIGDVLGAYIK